MAKFIWWLTVTISCLVNSVAPFHMEEIGFLINHYYTSNMGDEESPVEIYQRFFTSGDQTYQPCNPKTFNNESPRYNNTYKDYILCNENKYYFLPLGGKADDYKTFEIPEGEKVPIIAPTNMTLITKCTESKYSTYMELTVGNYRIVIKGMEYWYCCWGHTPFDGANYQHMAVTPNDYENKFLPGEVLGLANSETRITIYDGSDPISFAEYYADGECSEEEIATWKTHLDGTYIEPVAEETTVEEE